MENADNRSSIPIEDTVHFEVDASLLFELGEQLVARNSIALSELIKNAYDADATHVTVTLKDVVKPGGTIMVEDDGMGMPFEALQKTWMRIATNEKVLHPFSPVYHRPRTGAKGVGRFATRKLARKLTVRSMAQTGPSTWESITLDIDWDLYKPGENLSRVPARVTRVTHSSPSQTGVSLILSDVRDAWTVDDIVEVRNDLLDLVSPFPEALVKQDQKDPGFSVGLKVSDYPEYDGEIVDHYLSAAWARLTGVIHPDGSPEYILKVRGLTREISYRPRGATFPGLAGAKLLIHNMVYKGNAALEDLDIGVRDARRYGRRFGGVKVYMDSFRVFPYGDPGNDWLSLDEDKANRLSTLTEWTRAYLPENAVGRDMLYLPGNNNLFGGVFLSRTLHQDLKPKISREGFLENAGFVQLRVFTRIGIDWMTISRARLAEEERRQQLKRAEEDERKSAKPDRNARDKEQAPPQRTAVDVVQQTTAAIQQQLAEISRQTPIPEPVREAVNEHLNRLTKAIELHESEQISKIAMLRILASAGTTVVIFNHQIRAVLDGLRRLVHDLGPVGAQPSLLLWNDLDRMRERSQTWLKMMEAQATQLGLLLGVEARRRRRSLAVKPVIDQIVDTFEVYCGAHGIELLNSAPVNVRTPPLYEAELHSLLLNLTTNALKAVKEQAVRRVEFGAEDDDRVLTIWVQDTGYGIAIEDRNKVFEPFETTSTPDPILGVGTGLGLTMVRDIVSEHSGSVQFVDAHGSWRTRIEIKIPHGVDD